MTTAADQAKKDQLHRERLEHDLTDDNLEVRVRAAIALRVEAQRAALGVGYREVAEATGLAVNMVFRACQPTGTKYGSVRLRELAPLADWVGGFEVRGPEAEGGGWIAVEEALRGLGLEREAAMVLLSTLRGFQVGLAAAAIPETENEESAA